MHLFLLFTMMTALLSIHCFGQPLAEHPCKKFYEDKLIPDLEKELHDLQNQLKLKEDEILHQYGNEHPDLLKEKKLLDKKIEELKQKFSRLVSDTQINLAQKDSGGKPQDVIPLIVECHKLKSEYYKEKTDELDDQIKNLEHLLEYYGQWFLPEDVKNESMEKERAEIEKQPSDLREQKRQAGGESTAIQVGGGDSSNAETEDRPGEMHADKPVIEPPSFQGRPLSSQGSVKKRNDYVLCGKEQKHLDDGNLRPNHIYNISMKEYSSLKLVPVFNNESSVGTYCVTVLTDENGTPLDKVEDANRSKVDGSVPPSIVMGFMIGKTGTYAFWNYVAIPSANPYAPIQWFPLDPGNCPAHYRCSDPDSHHHEGHITLYTSDFLKKDSDYQMLERSFVLKRDEKGNLEAMVVSSHPMDYFFPKGIVQLVKDEAAKVFDTVKSLVAPVLNAAKSGVAPYLETLDFVAQKEQGYSIYEDKPSRRPLALEPKKVVEDSSPVKQETQAQPDSGQTQKNTGEQIAGALGSLASMFSGGFEKLSELGHGLSEWAGDKSKEYSRRGAAHTKKQDLAIPSGRVLEPPAASMYCNRHQCPEKASDSQTEKQRL